MHRGPHHDKYMHPSNRKKGEGAHNEAMEVHMSEKGSHQMGDKSHLKSLMGKPKGADVAGHNGKMHW